MSDPESPKNPIKKKEVSKSKNISSPKKTEIKAQHTAVPAHNIKQNPVTYITGIIALIIMLLSILSLCVSLYMLVVIQPQIEDISDYQADISETVTSTQNSVNKLDVDISQIQSPQAAPTQQKEPITTIDDDAILGDSNAPIAIVEFSDFNCPYCKQFHQNTFSTLVSTFVDTGRVMYLHRDYAGVGGQDTADAQVVAECVRSSYGDEAYFNLISAYYSSDENINKSKAQEIASSLNYEAESTCIDSPERLDEVYNDRQDGISAGVEGTPSFIIGRVSEDGTVKGVRIVGAQPLEVFKNTIESLE